MNNKIPLISVITVVYNGATYLEKTIQSVINQNYPNIEYIVIDGGSTDGTVEIIKKYNSQIAKWTSEPDSGIYDAMNKGLRKANGEWVNFLNGGDMFYSNDIITTIFKQLDHKQFDFIYGDSIIFSANSHRYIKARLISMESLKFGMEACHQSMFARKSISPAYNLEYKYKAEFNWVLDIFQNIHQERSCYISLPIVYYSLGGFSERGLLKNLMEFIQIIFYRFGFGPTFKNIPHYIVIFLRYLKYKFISYER